MAIPLERLGFLWRTATDAIEATLAEAAEQTGTVGAVAPEGRPNPAGRTVRLDVGVTWNPPYGAQPTKGFWRGANPKMAQTGDAAVAAWLYPDAWGRARFEARPPAAAGTLTAVRTQTAKTIDGNPADWSVEPAVSIAGTTADVLAQSIRNGTIADHVAYHDVHTGDTVFMPAGTLHALGPGALVYEVQETSDLTYRIYDWGRPQRAGRMLHIEQSIAVTNPQATGRVQPPVNLQPTDQQQLVQCPYFTLEILAAQSAPLMVDTRGQSFHAITLIEGQGTIECGEERVALQPLETVLVAASTRSYQLRPIGPRGLRALKSSVE